ncbi:unnamed protein product [Cylicocyclus nassatus]|uniref:SGNH domain-containing protein n=1 Tax=Cylicocyclus nassatus TaxID=53992 RepID=A0AA36DMS0_CYLNA|nr:unnamed protein product [Cylicocyclus nassatus]
MLDNLIPNDTIAPKGDANLNVAEVEATSEDLPRQAQELVDRIRMKGPSSICVDENARKKWKMIAIFAGLHDLGYLTCYNNSKKEPTTEWNFRIHFEEALAILRYKMKNTIVVLVPVIKPQVLVGARYKLDGITVPCWKGKSSTIVREDRVHWFNRMLEKVQFERKFETKNFAVVVRPYTNNIVDVIRVKDAVAEDAFYAEDHFHFSKYGNALFATYLWNSLFDPVGRKSTIRNLTDAAVLKCPPKEIPYIRTLGNSF